MWRLWASLWAICLYTGWLITWPVRHQLYARYHGNDMAGIVCAFAGMVFWLVVLLITAYLLL